MAAARSSSRRRPRPGEVRVTPASSSDGGRDYMFFHAYFGEGRGTGSALQISTLVWEDGWPRVGALP